MAKRCPRLSPKHDLSTGCPKSHCAKVRAYCSASDHLIHKISSRMLQENSSFEEYYKFKSVFIFSNERSNFRDFRQLIMAGS